MDNEEEIKEVIKFDEVDETLLKEKEEEFPTNKKSKKDKKEKNNIFSNLYNKIKGLTKKQKYILLGLIFLVLIFLSLIIYMLLSRVEVLEEEIIIEPVILEMNNYIYEDGTLIFLDESDNEIGSYECSNKDVDLCALATLNVDETLDIVRKINTSNEPIEEFVPYINDIVFVLDTDDVDNLSINMYNLETKEVLGTYFSVYTTNDSDYVILEDEKEKYGMVNLSNNSLEVVIDFEYDYLAVADDTMDISYKKNSKYGIVDLDGEILVSLNNPILNYNDNFIVSGYEDDYTLYDYTSKSYEGGLDFIKISGENAFLISDGSVTVRNSVYGMISFDEFDVSNEDYFEYEKYDSNLKKISDVSPFTTEITDENKLLIKQGTKRQTINLNESVLNLNYDYVNYLNGTIYIYEEATKENIVGSYICDNPNTVVKGDEDFKNCFIAYNENFVEGFSVDADGDAESELRLMPILSDQYIFINDTRTAATSNVIHLYDFTSSAIKASYSNIDSSYIASVKFDSITAKNFIVVAKNTSGSYGVINVTKSNINAIVPFSYSDLFFDNDNFIVRDAEGVNIYNVDGNRLTESVIPGEFIDYNDNYILIKNEAGKYQMFDYTGKVYSDIYDEIQMGEKYYMTILSNVVEVQSYTEKGNLLGKEVNSKDKTVSYNESGTVITIYFKSTGSNTTMYTEDLKDAKPSIADDLIEDEELEEDGVINENE